MTHNLREPFLTFELYKENDSLLLAGTGLTFIKQIHLKPFVRAAFQIHVKTGG